MIVYSEPVALDEIPLVDLSLPDDRIVEAIGQACRDIGFFYAINHGVPSELVDAQFRASRSFFALPDALKLALHMRNAPSKSGYEPIEGQQLDSWDAESEAAPPDLKESYWWGRDLPDDHRLANCGQRNMGHNQVPNALPGFREQMLSYQEKMAALGDRMLEWMALSLDLPEDWFIPAFKWGPRTVRLVHYPPPPSATRYNQLGAGAHTDWGAITLLAQDIAGGLEVRNADGDWVAAPPVADTFIVNLGGLMERWTNGVWTATMHRVKTAQSAGDRYSVAYFHSPQHDALITPAPSCVGPRQPARFETCTTTAHMDEMFRRSFGFAVTS